MNHILSLPLPQHHSVLLADEAPPLLLVEDDAEIRAVLVESLEDNGFRVVEAPSAEAAWALLDGGLRPPLLVTDINLGPGTNGLKLADAVHEAQPHMPVVFITGRLDMLRDRGLRPLEYVVPKPFPLSALMNVVRRFLPGVGVTAY